MPLFRSKYIKSSSILIEVSGGNISNISSTDESIKITIIDHDNLGQATNYHELRKNFQSFSDVELVNNRDIEDKVTNIFDEYIERINKL